MRYQDFVIQIGLASGPSLRARVVRSPAGEGETVTLLPPELVGLAARASMALGESEEGQWRDLVRRHRSAPPSPQELGGRLHDLLFSGTVGRLWDRSLGALRGRREEGLRVRLQLDAGDASFLGELPWELLYRADTSSFLALDRQTPILRHLEVAQPILPEPLPAALKVLGVAAAPRDFTKLNLAGEKEELEGRRKAARRWQIRFLDQPTVDGLRRELAEQGAHVLHFMGHGGYLPEQDEGVLYFEDGKGGATPFTGKALTAKLADVRSLRLVVLNACESAVSGGDPYGSVAAALVRGGLPAVVAMQRPIPDDAAVAFSRAFYRLLAAGAPLEAALTEGRQAIHTLFPAGGEWAIPVLFSRADEAGLFVDLASAARRRHRMAAIAVAASLILALSFPQVRAGLGMTDAQEERAFAMEIGQFLATGVDGLQGKLTLVEILPDGRMRLHFSFENRGEKARKLGFDFAKTYLADEHGNPYRVKASSSRTPVAAGLQETVSPGQSRHYWVEVEAPQDGARRLHVELVATPGSEASFTPFEVALPSYPKALSLPSPAPQALQNSDGLPLTVKIDNGRKDVFSELRKLEVSETKMRLSFDMWNKGTQPLAADFDPARIELRDLKGNILKPTGMGYFDHGRPVDLPATAQLRRAVRSQLFVDFPEPRTRSETWELKLATLPDSDFSFAATALRVTSSIFERARKSIEAFALLAKPKLEVRQRVDPPPAPAAPPPRVEPPPALAPVVPERRFEMSEGDQELQTSQKSIKAKITGVYRLSNQRLRFVVELGNLGGSPAQVVLRLPGTKLSDEDGRQFKLLASTFGETGDGGPDEPAIGIAPGSARELFFEFSGRVSGSELFTFLLGSADPETLRFKPIQTYLPPE